VFATSLLAFACSQISLQRRTPSLFDRTVTAKSSIQKSCSSEDDFCIIFLVLGSVGLLGSGVFFSILDLQARRSREMQILRMNPSAPETKNWTKDDPGKTEPGAASQDIAGLSKTGIR
jgi:hypothetical protein